MSQKYYNVSPKLASRAYILTRNTFYKLIRLFMSKIVSILIIMMGLQYKNSSKQRRPWFYPTQITYKHKAYDDSKVVWRKLGQGHCIEIQNIDDKRMERKLYTCFECIFVKGNAPRWRRHNIIIGSWDSHPKVIWSIEYILLSLSRFSS